MFVIYAVYKVNEGTNFKGKFFKPKHGKKLQALKGVEIKYSVSII